eukprot:11187951-Lingulodinium_polyedra.AAC.1
MLLRAILLGRLPEASDRGPLLLTALDQMRVNRARRSLRGRCRSSLDLRAELGPLCARAGVGPD